MLTMRPKPPASMAGSAARLHRKAPVRLTSIIRRNCASVVRWKGADSALPALLTRMATGPPCDAASAKADSTAASSVTSQASARAPGRVAARAASRSSLRPIKVRLAPSPASASAIAAPIPLPPPVTTACSPSRVLAMALDRPGAVGGAAQQALELLLAGLIRRRPGYRLAVIALQRRGAQRPVGIGKMRPGEAAEIGAAGGDDAVDMIDLGDVADRRGGDTGLLTDGVGKRRLGHPA